MREFKICIQYHTTKYAEFILGSFQDKVCLLDYKYRKQRLNLDQKLQKFLLSEFVEQQTTLLDAVKIQIDEYLIGKRFIFDFPYLYSGTVFEQCVWEQIKSIPRGESATYLELANTLGQSASADVARASGQNILALLIPCHRMLNNDGSISGYGGGVPLKEKLLFLEKQSTLL